MKFFLRREAIEIEHILAHVEMCEKLYIRRRGRTDSWKRLECFLAHKKFDAQSTRLDYRKIFGFKCKFSEYAVQHVFIIMHPCHPADFPLFLALCQSPHPRRKRFARTAPIAHEIPRSARLIRSS